MPCHTCNLENIFVHFPVLILLCPILTCLGVVVLHLFVDVLLLWNFVLYCRVSCHDAFWSHFLFFSGTVCLRTSSQLKLHLPDLFPLPSVHSCLTVLFSQLYFLVRNLYSFYFLSSPLWPHCHLPARLPLSRYWKSAEFKLRLEAFKLFTLKGDLVQFRVERTSDQPSNLILWPLFYWASWGDTFSNSLLLFWKKKWAINPTFWQSRVCIVQTNCSPMH